MWLTECFFSLVQTCINIKSFLKLYLDLRRNKHLFTQFNSSYKLPYNPSKTKLTLRLYGYGLCFIQDQGRICGQMVRGRVAIRVELFVNDSVQFNTKFIA